MNLLRVILATLVIFGTGALSGYFVAKSTIVHEQTAQPRSGGSRGGIQVSWDDRRKMMVDRMEKDLELDPDQAAKVRAIFAESGERSRELWKQFKGPMDAEVDRVNDQIRAILNPEQLVKFEEQLKRRKEGHRGPEKGSRKSSEDDAGEKATQPDHCWFMDPVIRRCSL
ncbi:MAG TPA: hypothetical protein DCY13_03720 [Verrucomicrobiales bacterium]|nr:hypothetical protein [Verrucomicrobiales bacterium]